MEKTIPSEQAEETGKEEEYEEGLDADEDLAEELFKENPLKAIWIKLSEMEEKFDNLQDALTENEEEYEEGSEEDGEEDGE